MRDGKAHKRPEATKGLSRGGFLKVGAAAATTLGAVPVAGAAARTAAPDQFLHLRLKTYQPLVNTLFTLLHPHQPLKARLIEVEAYEARGRRERARRESFSLVFEAQRAEPLLQGTYTLEHRRLGTFSLFLVPVGRGEKGLFLEAVVDRWLDASHP